MTLEIAYRPSGCNHNARITLRPFQLDDAPILALLANHKQVARFLNPLFPQPYHLTHAHAFLCKQHLRYREILHTYASPTEAAAIANSDAVPAAFDSQAVDVDGADASLLDWSVIATTQCFLESVAIVFQGKLAGTLCNFPPAAASTSTNAQDQAIELGYWLGLPFHRQGIMTQVLPVFIAQVRARYGANRMFKLRIHRDNVGSIALALKCGFQLLTVASVVDGITSSEPVRDATDESVLTYLLAS